MEKPASVAFVMKLCKDMGDTFLRAFQERDARMKELETKLAAAERKGFGIRYAGVWRDGKSYEQGQFATHQGGLWHCNEDTTTRPGTGSHWTLAVKSGAQ